MSRLSKFPVRWSVSLALILAVAPLSAEIPAWLKLVAAQPPGTYASDVPAVTLLDEVEVAVKENGSETITHRCAVRILNRTGRAQALAMVSYVEPDSRIVGTTAWLVRAGKEIRPADKRPWVDLSGAGGGQVASDVRRRGIAYDDLALDGDVFGYETIVTAPLLFAQESMFWGGEFPAAVSRFTIQLPAGWTLRSVLDGPLAGKVKTSTAPGQWAWEMADLPYRPDEPYMDGASRTDARLYVDFEATDGRSLPLRTFRSWADVSAWAQELQAPQCDTSPALAATVRELTANCSDNLSRVRALSRYVQNLRYVAVATGLTRGLGFRPRKATEVLAKGWGDCKAKANLLRAMLREMGIQSYMTSALAYGGRRLNESWCSPSQFDHAILGIRLDEASSLPVSADVAGLGRLLFFDATDPDVLLGDLPLNLQGSKVHVIAPGDDGLTTLPRLPAATHHSLHRQVKLELGASGSVGGTCSMAGRGSMGVVLRERIRTKSAKDLRTSYAERIAATVRGATLDDLATADDAVTGECQVDVRFKAANFAQHMPGGLAVVRLDVLSRDAVPAFPAKERKLPIRLDPLVVSDDVTLQLPSGWSVEEMPAKTELNSIYGRYESSYETNEGTVVSHRLLELEDRIVPVAEYAALKKFLGDAAKADRASVVLRRAEAAGTAAAPQ